MARELILCHLLQLERPSSPLSTLLTARLPLTAFASSLPTRPSKLPPRFIQFNARLPSPILPPSPTSKSSSPASPPSTVTLALSRATRASSPTRPSSSSHASGGGTISAAELPRRRSASSTTDATTREERGMDRRRPLLTAGRRRPYGRIRSPKICRPTPSTSTLPRPAPPARWALSPAPSPA